MENNSNIRKNWYVVNTYSSHENKVKDNLEKRIESHNLQDYIFRIVVAEHEVPVMKNGQPSGKTKMKNFFPGYIFVEMIMTNEAWYMVRNTPGVTGFLGSSGGGAKPFPVKREQIETVLKRMGMVDDEMFSNYNVGDLVKILTGAFEGSEGTIESIDKEANEVTITTVFFGRPQQISVKITEIDKVN